ncbi:MAG: UvrD-helicase domain-containing protein [Blastocatellia bacterium]|nr:UvrD-helicase domain-containing protein [Blastocatellia bacterium]
MITVRDLLRALATFRPAPDAQQHQAVSAPATMALFIVAGPGTGKTASLTLRILKLALVDGVPPRGILATTFTKKAAEELRSRILGWGFQDHRFPQERPFADGATEGVCRLGRHQPGTHRNCRQSLRTAPS